PGMSMTLHINRQDGSKETVDVLCRIFAVGAFSE
ncbi:aconitate hydratase, partial [Pseudomonas amygdali pv. mori str. 301020]